MALRIRCRVLRLIFLASISNYLSVGPFSSFHLNLVRTLRGFPISCLRYQSWYRRSCASGLLAGIDHECAGLRSALGTFDLEGWLKFVFLVEPSLAFLLPSSPVGFDLGLEHLDQVIDEVGRVQVTKFLDRDPPRLLGKDIALARLTLLG